MSQGSRHIPFPDHCLAGMENQQFFWKRLADSVLQLSAERDLRHQIEHIISSLQCLLRQFQINLRLSRSRNPVQQSRLPLYENLLYF